MEHDRYCFILSREIGNKGNNKITELRTILQRESQNSYVYKQTKSVNFSVEIKNKTYHIIRTVKTNNIDRS